MRDLVIVPVNLDEANAFVRKHHRHHAPVPGAKFCLAVAKILLTDEGGESLMEICGVAIVGRPVARMLDNTWTLEVNRTCEHRRIEYRKKYQKEASAVYGYFNAASRHRARRELQKTVRKQLVRDLREFRHGLHLRLDPPFGQSRSYRLKVEPPRCELDGSARPAKG